ncbi:MAG: acyltransferase family protein [Kofleriaceae bacterium]
MNELAGARTSGWLHTLRWMAALSVVMTHLNNRLFAPLHAIHISVRGLPLLGWTFVTGFAHQAVILFFVMSGYLVGGSALLELRRTGSFDVGGYLRKRVVRLVVVLWPALALGAVLDHVGGSLASGPYAGLATGPATLGCNAVFLQTIACAPYGTNGALWSLANEFWYYVLFALVVVAWTSGSRRWRSIAAIAAVSVAAAVCFARFATFPILPYFAIWALGLVPFVQPRPWITRTVRQSLAVFVAVLFGVRIGFRAENWEVPWKAFFLDVVVAGSFTNLLIALRNTADQRPIRGHAVHRWAAEFSYSLYATHVPVLTLALVAASVSCGAIPLVNPRGWSAPLIVAFIACAGIVAFLFSLATERQTARARLIAYRLFSRRDQKEPRRPRG